MATIPKEIQADVKLPLKLNLRDYVTYRRAQMQQEADERAANPGSPLGGGSVIARAERDRVILIVLSELEKLAGWLETGEPEFIPPLAENDKKYWRWCKEHGVEIPKFVEDQL